VYTSSFSWSNGIAASCRDRERERERERDEYRRPAFDHRAQVPRPHLFVDGVLLMELIVDADGAPAPRLFDVDLTEREALEIHEILTRQVVWMLCAGLVHGDLSECNVLLAWDGPTIIDLPQVADAAHNPNARGLFLRDVVNLTNCLARFAPWLATTQFGPEIWSLYERSHLHPDTPLTGRWKGSTKKADTRAVLREIEEAAREAAAKREADGEGPRRERRTFRPLHPTGGAPGSRTSRARRSRIERHDVDAIADAIAARMQLPCGGPLVGPSSGIT
jgi:serine/threonine-protein kinase RIO1